MRTAYKCLICSAPEQVSVLNRTFGCVRVVWNRTLVWRHARYRSEHAGTSFTQASAYLTAMKTSEDLAWLNEVSSVPLQQAIRHQQAAFSNFFADRARYPRYKSRGGRQCAEYTRSGFRYRDGRLLLAKMDTPLVFTWSWPDIDPASIDPTTVTISRDPCGRWYVSFAVDVPDPVPLPPAGAMAGVDPGVKDFAATSDGQKIPNPRTLARRERSLARYQRRLARGYDVIVIEDLNVKGMVCNRRLAKAISDCGWGEFRRQLEYKCRRAGRQLIVIDRWYPSSKTCSSCGHLLAELSLSTRTWQCPSCGTRHDRDINAAKNILAAGLAVARDSPGNACGGDIRHPGSPGCGRQRNRNPGPREPGSPYIRTGSSQGVLLPSGVKTV
jgi:putative transposase